MARRGRRKGRRSSKAIPVPLAVVGIYPALAAWKAVGASDLPALGRELVYGYTGYNLTSNQWSSSKIMPLAGGVLAALVAHKVANKVGLNSKIKKLTMGYLQI